MVNLGLERIFHLSVNDLLPFLRSSALLFTQFSPGQASAALFVANLQIRRQPALDILLVHTAPLSHIADLIVADLADDKVFRGGMGKIET